LSIIQPSILYFWPFLSIIQPFILYSWPYSHTNPLSSFPYLFSLYPLFWPPFLRLHPMIPLSSLSVLCNPCSPHLSFTHRPFLTFVLSSYGYPSLSSAHFCSVLRPSILFSELADLSPSAGYRLIFFHHHSFRLCRPPLFLSCSKHLHVYQHDQHTLRNVHAQGADPSPFL
jgi:hypothetical protein